MPMPDAVAPEIITRLAADPTESRTAWAEVRARLRREPEPLAEPLCAFLLESLEGGAAVPVRPSILPSLEVCTRERPDLLPAPLLDRLLARAADLDTLSVLCLGLMRVRSDAEGLITDGIQEILAATEHAIVPAQDEELRDVQEYAREIAVDLWETVADRDPAELVVILEFWTAAHGWKRPSTRLFLDLLLRVATRDTAVRESLRDALEAVRRARSGDDADPAPIEQALAELREMDERADRRALAESIATDVAPDAVAAARTDAPAPAPAALDPAVARWKDDYLSDDPERAFAAREPLGPEADNPRNAMVAGVVQAAEELFAQDPYDDRFGPLVNFLCRTAESRPDLVPAGVLERWTRPDALEEWEQAMVFATLAQVNPEALVRRQLPAALGAAAAAGGQFASTILAGVGRTDPDVLIDFAERWLEREGWTPDFGPAIACAFEQVARARPDRRDELIDLLRGHVVPGSQDGDGFVEISRCIERLSKLVEAGGA